MAEQMPAVRIAGFTVGGGTDRDDGAEPVVVIAFDVPGLTGPDGQEARMMPLAMTLVDAENLCNLIRNAARLVRRQSAERN